jgi:phage tail sheath gpL-like
MAAVGQDRASRVVGYDLTGADFSEQSPNLPMRIVILGEANHANQGTLDLTKKQINSQKQAGILYGFGSPIHMAMRILKPLFSDGVGGIPILVIPQAAAVGAQARIVTITPAGVATKSGTHFLRIAGRTQIDGQSYAINIVAGDNVAAITQKIEDAVAAMLASPVQAASTDYEATLTTKWRGLTAQGVTVEVDTGSDTLGITYTVSQVQAGSGQPSIASALAQIGNEWATHVLNAYGTESSIMSALEAFNGRPAEDETGSPTGRYVGTTWKPFIAVTGSVAEDPSSATDSRKSEVTIAIAPAPLSKALALEAAANMIVLSAVVANNTPHLDVAGLSYPDMPTPTSIGAMSEYDNRDTILKKGCSTVTLVAGRYQIQDLVTTYHPDGESVPQFRYVRNLIVDFNFRYGYLLLEQEYVIDKVIAGDNDVVLVDGVIKPKEWKQLLFGFIDQQVSRGLIVDAPFSKSNLSVNLSTTNPDRFETRVKYKRSGIARISATQAQAGFNYGTLN